MAEDGPKGGPMRAAVGLGLIVLLVLGLLFVMQQLWRAAAIEDCVVSGRTNCAQITSER